MKRHDPRRRSIKELQFQADKEYWKAEKSISKINPIFLKPHVAILDGVVKGDAEYGKESQ